MAWFTKKAPTPTQDSAPSFSLKRGPQITREEKIRQIAARHFVEPPRPKREDGSIATQDWGIPVMGNHLALSANVSESIIEWFGSQGFPGFQFLMLLSQHWLINAACEIPIIDALRKGYEIVSADGEEVDAKILADHKKLDKKIKLHKKLTWYAKKARVFGIAIAIFKVNSDDPDYYENPYNPDGIKKGSYQGIALPDPYYCTPQMSMDGYDPSSADFYEPEYWIVSGKRYHKSHLVIFRHGGELPSQLRPGYQWAGVSLVQQIYEAVYSALQASNEANRLLMTKRLMVRKGDVQAALLDQSEFEEKMQFFQQVRDNYGEQIIDSTEDLLQLETALAEVTNVIGQKFELVSAIARMPTNKLMQTQLQGFASSGEPEEAIYNGMLETLQEDCLTEFIDRHTELSIRSLGQAPFEFEIKWPPIDTITEKELAEINQLKATTDQLNIQSGAITGEEVNKRISSDPDSGYAGIKYVEPEIDYLADNEPDDRSPTPKMTEDASPIPAGSHWITTEEGSHILIGGDGKVIGGAGGNMNGKYYGSVTHEQTNEQQSTEKPNTESNKPSNNLTESKKENTISSTSQTEATSGDTKMKTTEQEELSYKQMKENGATSDEITAAMKANGLGISERSKAWDEINGPKPEAKQPKKIAEKKQPKSHDLSGIDNILDYDRRIKGTTGSQGKKLTESELKFLNDVKGKAKISEKQAEWLKKIGAKYNIYFNDLNISKPKPKSQSNKSYNDEPDMPMQREDGSWYDAETGLDITNKKYMKSYL